MNIDSYNGRGSADPNLFGGAGERGTRRDGCSGRNTVMRGTGDPQNVGRNGVMPGGKGNGKMLSDDPLEAIRELSFVKVELELYLDTHPSCKVALDYYHRTVDALSKLMAEYQAGGTPIVAAGSIDNNVWTWVKEPWPWQRLEDITEGKER